MTEHCKIPQNLIDEALGQWESLVEQAYDIFGVDCLLVYSGKSVKETALDTNNVPELNSINARRRMSDREYDLEEETVSMEKISEEIRIRVYWEAKEWQHIYGYTKVPENQVMFLTHLENADKLSQAIRVEFTDKYGKEYTFTRVSEPVPYGFGKDKYCSSIWEHTN